MTVDEMRARMSNPEFVRWKKISEREEQLRQLEAGG